MLIRITDHCTMACSHCFVNATPKGKHMCFSTFIKAVELANKLRVKVLIVSGGEPTDHPQYLEFMDYLAFNYTGIISVVSHGLFINDKERCEEVFGRNKDVQFQITNDKRWYPQKLCRTTARRLEQKYKNVGFVWKIGGELFPQGRARRHLKITEDNAKVKGTRCFNLRSFVNSPAIDGVAAAIRELEQRGKFCTPSININGSIGMGESNECPETAYVTDSLDTISNSIKRSQCNDCGMLNKLSPAHHHAIGYLG